MWQLMKRILKFLFRKLFKRIECGKRQCFIIDRTSVVNYSFSGHTYVVMQYLKINTDIDFFLTTKSLERKEALATANEFSDIVENKGVFVLFDDM